jgi:pimeloyl-ACP methyl ester carboxylesterase
MRAGTLRVSGGMLETGWWGPGPEEAPTLVLLHEGLGCVALWRDVPERLAEATGWGVFAYSRFGYGGSDTTVLPRPMTYMHHEGQVVLPEVLRAAGIRQAVLVGHSDGGSIAAIYAGTFGNVSGPGLGRSCGGASGKDVGGRAKPRSRARSPGHDPKEEPGHDTKEEPGHDTERGPADLLGLVTIAAHFFVEDLNVASIRRIGAEYETGDLRQRLGRYHRDVDTAFRGWNGAWLDPRFRAFDITALLPTIQVPILALQGANDPYGTDEQLRVFAAKVRVPITPRLIRGAKHAPHLEVKDETVGLITDFIADLQRGFFR